MFEEFFFAQDIVVTHLNLMGLVEGVTERGFRTRIIGYVTLTGEIRLYAN